jgi:hypothetical protein
MVNKLLAGFWSRTSVREVTERNEVHLTGKDIRKLLGLSDSTTVSVHVPGGGDWSNMDLDLDDEVTLDIVETKKWAE